MRFSLKFIQQFLKLDLKPASLAQKLTMAGMEVEALEKIGDDWIFDIEVTTNRYDWLAMVGIAQEIAAVLGRKLKIEYPQISKQPVLGDPAIIIEDAKDCPYYIGRLIKGVKVGAPSLNLKNLITNCGLTSVNNVVDITNYCMLKWGNPLHAFDQDKLEGNIYIRRAKKGESFIGIDEKSRALDKNNLVIADSKKIVALAGVIGAKNSGVDSSTKNIFLEAAIFSPSVVRCSRRGAGVDTESSYRFERRVSLDYLEFASKEAAQLIAETAKGSLVAVARAGRKPKVLQKKITVTLSALENYLGCLIPAAKFKKILISLGFGLKQVGKDKYLLSTPAQRFDLIREVDVYEEVSRIYGYDKIPARIPFLNRDVSSSSADTSKSLYHFNNQLAGYVALLGFKEIISYSIEDPQALGLPTAARTIGIVNPLRKQENSLRGDLLLGMIKAIAHNLNRNQNNLYFFEIAHSYLKDKKGFLEIPVLALAASGRTQGFFYLKGALEKILQYTNNQKFQLRKCQLTGYSEALEVLVGGQRIGFVAKVNQAIKKNFGLKEDLFFAQLNIAQLITRSNEKKYANFSPYPVVWRDISISLGKDLNFAQIEETIKAKSKYLVNLQIVDIYKGKDIPPETTAFTLRIFYQSSEKTLTSQEVDTFHNQIRQALSQQRGLQLR